MEATLCVAVTVTVPPPEFASKTTSSDEPGTLAPPAPPLVALQTAVETASQLLVPPTQYRLAIFTSIRSEPSPHCGFRCRSDRPGRARIPCRLRLGRRHARDE